MTVQNQYVQFTPPSLPHPAQTTPATACTPQAGPSRTPVASPLAKTHTYPSTAPLPHLSSFLGSPFSTKTARGRYVYQAISPSQQATRAAATEGPVQGFFDQVGHEGLEGSEWMADAPGVASHAELNLPHRGSSGLPQPTSRLRRDTNGSTSSMDDFSGSGTSSASLMSLARSSMDHPTRPSVITVWSEESHGVFDEEEEVGTPSRQLFPGAHLDGSLHMIGKALRATAGESSAVPKVPSGTPTFSDVSPASDHLSSQTPPGVTVDAEKLVQPTIKPSRSPLSSFLPRLLSVKKKDPVLSESVARRKASPLQIADEDDVLTDTEGLPSAYTSRSKAFWGRTKPVASRNPMEGGDFEPSRGVGLGLGIRRTSETSTLKLNKSTVDLSRSLSSESGDEVETSPLRQVSAKGSTSMFLSKPGALSPGPLANQTGSKSAFHARRKTMILRETAGASGKSSPAVASNRPGRPARPFLRRGITEPSYIDTPMSSSFLSVDSAFHTPTAALFGDIKPSPAAFASTGLVKKKSGMNAVEIPKFGSAGVNSEPVGPAKMKQAAAQHGMRMESPSPLCLMKPLNRPGFTSISATSMTSGSSGSTSTGPTSRSSGSAAAYVQAAQKTRGLRRKGSSMFSVSGSIGSIDMMRSDSRSSSGGGPATPTKPGLHLTPIGLGVTTPSPRGATLMYPFASTSTINLLATPPSSDPKHPDSLDPPSVDRYRNMPPRLRQISEIHLTEQHGPVARASNPMLATSYKVGGVEQGSKLGNVGGNGEKAKLGGKMEKDFLLLQSLGSGAFSQVWKVRDKKEGKLWAVKAGKPYTGAKNRLRQLEEISILRQLSFDPHPNVIGYIDSWESRSRLYIRTSLAECGDLSRFLGLLGDFGGLDEARVWKTLVELASGVEHIHTHNFIHLDLKPSNILIDREGGLKIADFGMSVICTPGPRGLAAGGVSPALPERDDEGGFVWSTPAHDKHSNDQVQQDGGGGAVSMINVIPSPILDREVEGDREYLCPEALSEGQVGKSADVFSLGILILEAAMNVVLPSNGDGWIKLRNDDFSDLTEHYSPRNTTVDPATSPAEGVLPTLSDQLLSLVKKMMCSDPDARASLDDVWSNEVIGHVLRAKRGKALVEEDEEWLKTVLS